MTEFRLILDTGHVAAACCGVKGDIRKDDGNDLMVRGRPSSTPDHGRTTRNLAEDATDRKPSSSSRRIS